MAAGTPATSLHFKSVADLLSCHFLVEDYQRGYKWTRQEVEDLLNDIEGFGCKYPHSKYSESFYCLQPVVVQLRPDASYELIDGQQRVTTLYMILAHLKASGLLDKNIFQIDYRTRKGSAEFLPKIASFGITRDTLWETFWKAGSHSDNIDNFHFFEAYQTIVKWFEDHQPLAATLCADILQRCRVIWYQAKLGSRAKEIFIRLNSGKIALTNAELIKALFLQESVPPVPAKPETGEGGPDQQDHDTRPSDLSLRSVVGEHHRQEIAQQWDQIEFALQGEAFWGFINERTGKTDPPTRIEFLFNLISGRISDEDTKHSFRYYARLAEHQDFNADEHWRAVMFRFQYLREWYENPKLYHLVGYVITRGLADINDLLKEAAGSSKTRFEQSILETIQKKVEKYKPLAELQYGEHNEQIHNLLLLFNIRTILDSRSATRFPFERYKKANWSLEHIHAQNAKELTDRDEFERWDRYHRRRLSYLDGEPARALRQEMDGWRAELPAGPQALTEAQATRVRAVCVELETMIDDLLRSVRQHGQEPARAGAETGTSQGPVGADNLQKLSDEEMHGIGNLALLGRDENSSLSNDYFPDKRKRIIAMDQEGKFIPAATKNVFLKYYSHDDAPQVDLWGPVDCENYSDAIGEALKLYGVKHVA